MNQENIRNVCLIAHIDHGKSTLADRLLEKTGTIPPRKMRARILDDMELEQEKGVTIKLKAVRIQSTINNEQSTINLIDTPGHVDFSYEVSRSLAAAEGALLIVDASQGIQAQTISHFEAAQKQGLKLIPVINKIDLDTADISQTEEELINLGFKKDEFIYTSAEEDVGTEEVLEAVAERVPPPEGALEKPFRALVFDSNYDKHQGVVAYVRVVDGEINQNTKELELAAKSEKFKLAEIGYFSPGPQPTDTLSAGDVGYIATGLKDPQLVRSGDTIRKEDAKPLPGYKEAQPVVFASIYPIDQDDFGELKIALEKLQLNDAALSIREESSGLGRGFQIGFLGAFHAEITKERLEREYGLELLLTSPNVQYKVTMENGEEEIIEKAQNFPNHFKQAEEPWANVNIYLRPEDLGTVIDLITKKRGEIGKTTTWGSRLLLNCKMPLAELISGFYNQLKSLSSGFASLDWEMAGWREVDAVRMDILVHHEVVPPLSRIVIRDRAERVGRQIAEKLKEILPQEQFAVAIQAKVGGRIVARETKPAIRKDVTAKLYGGDRTRKDKLLKQQKAGKKKLAKIGNVDVPPEALRIQADL